MIHGPWVRYVRAIRGASTTRACDTVNNRDTRSSTHPGGSRVGEKPEKTCVFVLIFNFNNFFFCAHYTVPRTHIRRVFGCNAEKKNNPLPVRTGKSTLKTTGQYLTESSGEICVSRRSFEEFIVGVLHLGT